MAGTKPTPGAVTSTLIPKQIPSCITTQLVGPLSTLVCFDPQGGSNNGTIKAIWRNEIGDAR